MSDSSDPEYDPSSEDERELDEQSSSEDQRPDDARENAHDNAMMREDDEDQDDNSSAEENENQEGEDDYDDDDEHEEDDGDEDGNEVEDQISHDAQVEGLYENLSQGIGTDADELLLPLSPPLMPASLEPPPSFRTRKASTSHRTAKQDPALPSSSYNKHSPLSGTSERDAAPTRVQPQIQGQAPIAALVRQRRIVPQIDELQATNIYAREPTYFTRPNRYFGPASNWKRWTLQERTTVTALERTRAMDLGLHLMHAHLLRKHVPRDGQSVSKSQKGKERAKNEDVDTEYGYDDYKGGKMQGTAESTSAKTSFRVPRSWTAWPMLPEEVPRSHLLPDLDHEAASTSDVYSTMNTAATAGPGLGSTLERTRIHQEKPSSTLEDVLVAMFTKIARQTWNERKWQHAPVATVYDADKKARRELRKKANAEVDAQSPALQDEEASENERMGGVHEEQNDDSEEVDQVSPPEAQSESSDDDGDDDDDNNQAGMFSSQAMDMSRPGPSPSPDSELDEVFNADSEHPYIRHETKPVPIADDEKAKALLLPSVRHILVKLDDLLLGLHKARQSYAPGRRSGTEVSETGSQVDDIDDEDVFDRSEKALSNAQATTRGRQLRVSRKRKRSNSVVSFRTDMSTTSVGDEAGPSSGRQGLRDWSDVLGMAALTGWSPDVIGRASERCAALFGENMLFRTFVSANPLTNERAHFTEEFAQEPADLAVSDSDSNMENYSTTRGRTDSVSRDRVELVRISKACENCRNDQSLCLPSVLNGNRRNPCRRCIETSQVCSGIITKDARKRMKICPLMTCERHSIPFEKTYHLQRHIDSVHADESYDIKADDDDTTSLSNIRGHHSSSPAQSSGYTTGAETDDSAVRLILCPKVDCPRHVQRFSRANKLYSHIRDMHPEINVEDVKKLQAKRRSLVSGRSSSRSRSASAKPRRRYNMTNRLRKSEQRKQTLAASKQGEGNRADLETPRLHDP